MANRPCITCGNAKESGVGRGARVCLACARTCHICRERPRLSQHRKCKECTAAADKKRRGTPQAQFAQRITRIASVYKVRRPFAAILAVKPTCDACGATASDRGLHVDHCHKTGKVRGVLCFGCNATLGHLGDSADRLRALIEYLARTSHFQGIPDLEKAKHYIELLIELETAPSK